MVGTDGLHAGAASAIGSLPYLDADWAARVILDAAPKLPAVPELTRASPASTLLGAVAAAVPGLVMTSAGLQATRPIDPEIDLDVGPHPERDAGLFALLAAADDSLPAIKVQVPGPVTVATALTATGMPVADASRLALRYARARAAALLDHVVDALPVTVPVVCFDEPGLVTLADDRAVMTTSEAIDAIAEALADVESIGVGAVHCCGRTDWGAVLQTGAEIVFAPLEHGLEELPGAVGAHLDRGGWIGWGVVPTDEPLGTTGERSWKRLAEIWCSMVRAGCDPLRLRTQALVTPDCGLAGHGESQAERVLDVTASVAAKAHDQVVAVRFAVGA
ncbi:MAG: hypothetical protein AAFZ07_17825 [Actinomycetota bacterium]